MKDLPVLIGDHRDPIHLIRGCHHREGLLTPAEAALQNAGRLLNAGDMESPDPPDGDDRARIEEGCRLPDRLLRIDRRPVGPE